MNKYDLMKLNDSVIRIIDIKADKLLITDCVKRTMPTWVTISDIKDYHECTVTELKDTSGKGSSARYSREMS